MTRLYAVQNDNQVQLAVVLTTGEPGSTTPLDLSAATSVRFYADGPARIDRACQFDADVYGNVSVTLLAADLATAGLYDAQWQATFSDGTIVTVPDPGFDLLDVTRSAKPPPV